ncbi:DNA ligase 1-like [Schistocerca nitens]|uniref:DNA ligase 1-like n=1 Tax=Schistocerca nitens TaxID=7011 RepID=UPI0021175E65|nr:DNA ligase 1-like [Schistocerca nitens]
MLVDLIKKSSQEAREREEIFRKSLKEDLQETREEGRISRELLEKSLRESLEKSSQETRESLKEDLQEIKTSQMKMEYNLKKEMQELQERLKMDIDERERKLQKSIDQVQGDVEKVEGKLTRKIEDDIEETKAKLGERINEVETNCNHRIAEVTQMQKQCNDAVKGIGDRQNQLAINLRNAIALQREEDNKRVQQLESKTEVIDKRISNATLAIGGGIDWLNEVDAIVSFDEGTIKVKGRKGEEKRLKFAEGNAIEEEEEFRRVNLCHEEESTMGYEEEELGEEVLIYLEGLAREDRHKEDKISKKLEEMTHLDERTKKQLATPAARYPRDRRWSWQRRRESSNAGSPGRCLTRPMMFTEDCNRRSDSLSLGRSRNPHLVM